MRIRFIFAILIIIVISGCVGGQGVSGPGENSEESSIEMTLNIQYSGEWSGSVGYDGNSRSISGSGGMSCTIVGANVVSATIQKQERTSDTLRVSIESNGDIIANSRTQTEFGVVSVSGSTYQGSTSSNPQVQCGGSGDGSGNPYENDWQTANELPKSTEEDSEFVDRRSMEQAACGLALKIEDNGYEVVTNNSLFRTIYCDKLSQTFQFESPSFNLQNCPDLSKQEAMIYAEREERYAGKRPDWEETVILEILTNKSVSTHRTECRLKAFSNKSTLMVASPLSKWEEMNNNLDNWGIQNDVILWGYNSTHVINAEAVSK